MVIYDITSATYNFSEITGVSFEKKIFLIILSEAMYTVR